MFGPLGFPEMLFIIVLALLIFGPKRLPEVGRTIGKGMAQFRRATTDLKRTIENEIALEEKPAPRPSRPAPTPGRSILAAPVARETEASERLEPAERAEPVERVEPVEPEASAEPLRLTAVVVPETSDAPATVPPPEAASAGPAPGADKNQAC
ncbi:MAG: twin-arginine translocase TatA/TatE family subunit [Thermoanaerobaculia bacterium]